MSIKIMNRIWELRDDAQSPAERLVLVALADQCNNEGFCWPSIQTIASHAGVSTRYARELIGRSEERGHVLRIERHRDGAQTSNVYIVTVGMDGVELEAARSSAQNALGVTFNPRNDSSGGGGTYAPGGEEHTLRGGRNDSSDRTVIEPLVEPPTNQQGAPETLGVVSGQAFPEEPLYDVCSFVMNLFQETFGMMPSYGPDYQRDWEDAAALLVSQAGEDETKLRVVVDEAHAKWKAATKPGTNQRYPARSPRGVWKFVQAVLAEMSTAPTRTGPEPGSIRAAKLAAEAHGPDVDQWPDPETAKTGRLIAAAFPEHWHSDPVYAVACYGVAYA